MTTPSKLAKSGSESAHQGAFFAYVAVAMNHGFQIADRWCEIGNYAFLTSPFGKNMQPLYPQLKWLHAIPNGGLRDKRTAANLKREGVKKGIPDIYLPYPNGGYHGLYIEMKKPSVKAKSATAKGGMSDEQIEFKEYCGQNGYAFSTCYGWREAADALKMYLSMEQLLINLE